MTFNSTSWHVQYLYNNYSDGCGTICVSRLPSKVWKLNFRFESTDTPFARAAMRPCTLQTTGLGHPVAAETFPVLSGGGVRFASGAIVKDWEEKTQFLTIGQKYGIGCVLWASCSCWLLGLGNWSGYRLAWYCAEFIAFFMMHMLRREAR